MKMKAWILGSLNRIWSHGTLQYGMAASACAIAIWMQYQYRLQGSTLFLLLPAIGAILLALNILLIMNQFAKDLPRWDPVRCILNRVEWSAGLLVQAFVYSRPSSYMRTEFWTIPLPFIDQQRSTQRLGKTPWAFWAPIPG